MQKKYFILVLIINTYSLCPESSEFIKKQASSKRSASKIKEDILSLCADTIKFSSEIIETLSKEIQSTCSKISDIAYEDKKSEFYSASKELLEKEEKKLKSFNNNLLRFKSSLITK